MDLQVKKPLKATKKPKHWNLRADIAFRTWDFMNNHLSVFTRLRC